MGRRKDLWVIKVGSQLIVDEGPLLVRNLIRDVTELKARHNVDVVIVSSGAIATARIRLGKQWRTLPEKQALSALGQPMVMELYNLALQSNGLMGAQVLLTYADLKAARSRRNFVNTIRQLLTWNVVPILNENDAVATDEIQFGDNDFLSALVACEMKARKLVLMTNVDGLFDRPPEKAGARLIAVLDKISPKQITEAHKANRSTHGRGGMASKLEAAQKAAKNNVHTHIVRGSQGRVLLNLAEGQRAGTWIPPKKVRK